MPASAAEAAHRSSSTDVGWRRMFAFNLDGVFHALQPIVRHMVERAAQGDAFGRIAATSSMAALFGSARNEHSAASKAAVNCVMKGARGRARALRHHRERHPSGLWMTESLQRTTS